MSKIAFGEWVLCPASQITHTHEIKPWRTEYLSFWLTTLNLLSDTIWPMWHLTNICWIDKWWFMLSSFILIWKIKQDAMHVCSHYKNSYYLENTNIHTCIYLHTYTHLTLGKISKFTYNNFFFCSYYRSCWHNLSKRLTLKSKDSGLNKYMGPTAVIIIIIINK